MPDGGLETAQDVEDFARGTDFLSASGGGSTRDPVRLLGDDLARGVPVRWRDLGSLDDDALVVSTFYSGSIAPPPLDAAAIAARYGATPTVERPLVEAVRELEGLLGRTVDAIIAVEIGGSNSGHAADAAANLGTTLLDADYAGRAIPEAQCVTPTMFGESMAPFAAVDVYGDVTLVRRVANDRMAERLGKFLAQAAFRRVGCAAFPLPGRSVKRLAIGGTLTESLAIGRAIRLARSADDPVRAVAAAVPGATLLFRGAVAARTWENRDGYMWGEHEIAGDRGFAGTLRVWFKNENHVTWLDGRPYVASPDVIELVDDATGEPRINTDVEVGDRVAIIAVRRRAHFDTPQGIAAMGPRHWGFDLDFQPLESLVHDQ